MRPPSYHYSKPQYYLLTWLDLNQQPFTYKATALTIELQVSLGWLNKIRTCISAFVAQHSHPLNYKPYFLFIGWHRDSLPAGRQGTLFFRCTDGCFADKLESTSFVTGFRFELKTPDSSSGMLPITPSGNQCSMSDSNTLPQFGRPVHRHQCICCS